MFSTSNLALLNARERVLDVGKYLGHGKIKIYFANRILMNNLSGHVIKALAPTMVPEMTSQIEDAFVKYMTEDSSR